MECTRASSISAAAISGARALSNRELSPHLSFIDMGGHGYAALRVSGDEAECEFVCIPRPLERSPDADGGPLRYRVRHEVPLWRAGERPRMRQTVVQGDEADEENGVAPVGDDEPTVAEDEPPVVE